MPYIGNQPTPVNVGSDSITDGSIVNADINSSAAIAISKLDGVTSTNTELNLLDGVTSTTAELNILDGVTSTAAELNILDGVTATAAELNLLDGVTATTAELNYVDGVTSNVQTQLNAKLADVVSDTSPQLGGNLDMNGQDIVTTSNANLDLAPNGTGKVVVRGNTNSAKIVLNCENNSHGVTLASPPHSASATYEVALPSTLGLTNASAVVTSDANGVVSFDNGTIEESTVVTSSSNAATINLRDGNVFTHTLSENVTYTFSNPAASGRASAFILKVVQDSSARTITWPGTVDWAAATAPTITATNAGVDVFAFITVDGGSNYYGFTLGQAMG
jgi:predicted secreted protein